MNIVDLRHFKGGSVACYAFKVTKVKVINLQNVPFKIHNINQILWIIITQAYESINVASGNGWVNLN